MNYLSSLIFNSVNLTSLSFSLNYNFSSRIAYLDWIYSFSCFYRLKDWFLSSNFLWFSNSCIYCLSNSMFYDTFSSFFSPVLIFFFFYLIKFASLFIFDSLSCIHSWLFWFDLLFSLHYFYMILMDFLKSAIYY
jgi:hypothetical protein